MKNNNLFEKRLGLWLFCVNYHSGQPSQMYRIQCKLYNFLVRHYGKRYLDDLTLKTLPYNALLTYTMFLEKRLQDF